MREGMNIFFIFTNYLRLKKIGCKYIENPFKNLYRVYKLWGLKCFILDNLNLTQYKYGFKNIKELFRS